MLFRLRTQNFYIYYYQFYYILNIELFQNYNIKNAPISQYILQLFSIAFHQEKNVQFYKFIDI